MRIDELCEMHLIKNAQLSNIAMKNEGGMPNVLPLNSTMVAAEKGDVAAKRYNSLFVLILINQYTPSEMTGIPTNVNISNES